jgi:hypothetical protein
MTDTQYPIGTPGTPWDDAQKQAWRSTQVKRRSYQDEVLRHLEDLHTCFQVQRYGELIYPEGRYPLYGIVTRDWNAKRPAILVTGGVHGYETSGVQGAVRFVQTRAVDYTGDFNIAVAPCISPWAYETINRWNPDALDPNRSFVDDSSCGEAALVMAWVRGLAGTVLAHFDLHETTDTDNSEFRPALAARDGMTLEEWPIPDGFYLVDDSEAPQPEFQRAIIDAVKTVTHIAPADASGCIIGTPTTQPGVINYDLRALGLCAGMTDAPYRTTTEVYPDSPAADGESCIKAQVVAVCGGLAYLRSRR